MCTKDDVNCLNASVTAMYIEVECDIFPQRKQRIETNWQVISTNVLGTDSSNLTAVILECKKSQASRTTNFVWLF